MKIFLGGLTVDFIQFARIRQICLHAKKHSWAQLTHEKNLLFSNLDLNQEKLL